MSPLVLAAAGGVALWAIGGAVWLAWQRARSRALQHRLRQAAAPLSGPGVANEKAAEVESVFRTQRRRSLLRRLLWERIERRWPLLDAPIAAIRALGAGCAGALVAWAGLLFLRLPGAWAAPAAIVAGVATAAYALSWLHARRMTRFSHEFPDVVDQIVRLSVAGVPVLEAISEIAEDAPPAVAPVLRELRDGLVAGLDSGAMLSAVATRVRITEFTMFAAVVRLQRRSGGGVSAAFSNLSETLRERRKTALKAHASTAQTRLTLLMLAIMPVAVVTAQSFISPQSVDVLFGTDSGITLLRWGVCLIVAGLLAARAIAVRAAR